MAYIFAATLAVLLCLPHLAAAQSAPAIAPATLIADNIRFDGTSSVTADGSVEVFFEGTRLRAQSISFDGETDRLVVQGPMTLTEPSGNTVIIADFGELSSDLQNGVMQSARLVLDRELQIAATEINRSEGRYTQAYQAVASYCEVCFENPTPLWEIRARRIIHDEAEQQLYFNNAHLRVLGIPVFYLPQLRLPDPNLERATGFLVPDSRQDNVTGTHLLTPYFIRLGDHADLTLTPWIGTGGQTVEGRYRQAFRHGYIQLDGALTWDDLTDDDTRGYFFSVGTFDLPRDFTLDLQAQAVSDRGYLRTYDFSGVDLLESFVRLSRVDREQYVGVSATVYETLRDGVDNDTLPTRVGRAEITRRFTPNLIGGILTADLEATTLYRFSDIDGPDGRDVSRITGMLDWRRTEVYGGLVTTFEGAMHGGYYNTRQGGDLDGQETRLTPYAAVEMRYPLQAAGANGVSHLIEPAAQLVWSDTYGDPVPNEDSFLVELDEANLFSLDRFPGSDQRETGARANVGLTYTRSAPSGFHWSLAGGLVLRAQDEDQFTEGSGLDGVQSDYLVATHLRFGQNLSLINRALFDTNFDFTSSEISLFWTGERHTLGTSYTYLESDLAEDRPRDLAEWIFDARYEIDSGWDAGVDWRYDFTDGGPTSTGLSLGFANECVDMEFSVSRSYTDSATVEPSTTFGFEVALAGFGASREGRSTARSCRG
ncbi:LPS assembly protein LptD [Gymnodinialimonas sp. 2305UL16-5]|uniref:LPS-assembly protein LptD n=1 Tax=Gymnodinialimonas mytili TaxID=3126503 RepID=UPI0030AEEB6E